MATLQDDIGTAIAATVAGFTDVLDGSRCGYGVEWDASGHINDKGRAWVKPGPVRLPDDSPIIAASGVFQYDFEIRMELVERKTPQNTVTEALRLCRKNFQPESRVVQAALSNTSGDLLGATVVCNLGEFVITTRGEEQGAMPTPNAPIIYVTVTATAAEDLS